MRYVKVTSGLVDELVPEGVVTETTPVGVAPFGRLGAATLRTVSETTFTLPTGFPSTVTETVAALKPDPTMVSGVPPAGGPVRGQTAVTVGDPAPTAADASPSTATTMTQAAMNTRRPRVGARRKY